MRARDTAAWEERKAALRADGETGQAFLSFIEDWADAAEKVMKHCDRYGPTITEAEALRGELVVVETRHARVGAHYLGQMLAVLADHWEYGIDMMQSLTPIEQRLVEDMVLIKIAESQASAEGDTR